MSGPNLLNVLQDTNPIPDPVELEDSDEARELALRRPGSVIAWRVIGDEYHGDGYRIRLLEPRKWEITRRGRLLEHHHSLKAAFAIVEHDRREALRRRDLVFYATTAVLAAIGLILTAYYYDRGNVFWVPGILAVLYVGLSAVVRFFANLSRNINDPYRRRLPWERRRYRRR